MMIHHIEVAGERLTLHAQRAIHWAARRTLLVSDVHFGKGAVFRRAGIAVPSGDTEDDLARLDMLVAEFAPERVVVLGDLVHGAATERSGWVERVRTWRQGHAAIAMALIAGNHDRHFDVASLGMDVHPGHVSVPPFVFSHHPEAHAEGYTLAGHVHPGVSLRDGWRRHRLPAFVFDRDVGMLPAFGTLTGLHDVMPRAGRRIVAVTPAGLLPLC
ncbi:ligase-associated DNA damage response endonuclease PdeM [Luteibacter yeojuensis]|uniref:Ligase-associated DNA damage response endonuclease PdeM n=1 Tax=Luteibacter yeojuensis TaxID=345309 RepID=A0A7X5QS53_9GAMM|nr:ligase-associated DNA damage response endonuclease PdeM [Luteibacter yeojuensis]NID14307.1 ligase-associated DNA damage response endonuclease PdeM [Luteibacter yeojuensis]